MMMMFLNDHEALEATWARANVGDANWGMANIASALGILANGNWILASAKSSNPY
jgi:hypothetical protein